MVTRPQKWQLYSGIQKRLLELLQEEKWWLSVRAKQLNEDIERDEYERKSAETFNRETFEILICRRRKAFKVRRIARNRKSLALQRRKNLGNIKREHKHDSKTESEFIDELITKNTPESLRKWLYRNLCLLLAPRKSSDPDWKQKNLVFQEVVLNRHDLKRLKEISEQYRPDWSLFFRC